MADAATLARARSLLDSVGYGDEVLHEAYPVWVPESERVERADLVAFTQPAPKDMSTAVIVVHLTGPGSAHQVARALGVPYVFTPNNGAFDLSVVKPGRLELWRTIDVQTAAEVARWIRPDAATRIKVGLRQPPLFDIPVNFLAHARDKSSERLGPIIGEALMWASEELAIHGVNTVDEATRAHKTAARLVVGALTALAIRDRDPLDNDPVPNARRSVENVINQAAKKHPATSGWADAASDRELCLA